MRTVANADHIIVLKDDVVAEEGAPEKLIMSNGIFSHMMKTQMKTAQWKF